MTAEQEKVFIENNFRYNSQYYKRSLSMRKRSELTEVNTARKSRISNGNRKIRQLI